MDAIRVGYFKFPSGDYLKFYINDQCEAGQRVYVEARCLPVTNESQKHATKWRRWVAKGVQVSHMLPSERSGPRAGTHPQWPPTMPELQISLGAMIFLLTDASKGMGSCKPQDSKLALHRLQLVLTTILGTVQEADMAGDFYFLTVSLKSFRRASLPLECERTVGSCGEVRQEIMVDVDGLLHLPKSELAMDSHHFLPRQGYLSLVDLLRKLHCHKFREQFFATCQNLAKLCETLLHLS